MILKGYVLDGRTVQAHEWVPLLLVSDCRTFVGDDTVFDECLETSQRKVCWVDALRKREVALGVLVAVVHDRLVWKGAEVGERGVHLAADALEETAAACDKQGVAREDAAGMVPSVVGHVVANRVLGVARRRETSALYDRMRWNRW